MGENGTACMKELVKCSTPGVTAAIASRHSGTARLALRLRGGEESETRARHNQQHHREEGGTRACRHKVCDMRPSAQHPVCLHATHYRPQQMPRDSRIKARLGTRVPPQLDHVVQHACEARTAAVVSPTRRELLRVQRTAPLSTAHGALASVAPPPDLLHIGCSPITTRHHPAPSLGPPTDFGAAEEHELARRVGCHLVGDALFKRRQQPWHAVVPWLELRCMMGGHLRVWGAWVTGGAGMPTKQWNTRRGRCGRRAAESRASAQPRPHLHPPTWYCRSS